MHVTLFQDVAQQCCVGFYTLGCECIWEHDPASNRFGCWQAVRGCWHVRQAGGPRLQQGEGGAWEPVGWLMPAEGGGAAHQLPGEQTSHPEGLGERQQTGPAHSTSQHAHALTDRAS